MCFDVMSLSVCMNVRSLNREVTLSNIKMRLYIVCIQLRDVWLCVRVCMRVLGCAVNGLRLCAFVWAEQLLQNKHFSRLCCTHSASRCSFTRPLWGSLISTDDALTADNNVTGFLFSITVVRRSEEMSCFLF